MSSILGRSLVVAAALLVAGGAAQASSRHRAASRHVAVVAAGDRPLTISRHHGNGIYRQGDDIIAPGGFSAHGYGYPPATADDRREALNARIRANATGLYGSGVDGLGGIDDEDGRASGYDNPYYGNAFSPYVGFNGVPTHLAFGPGFANRYYAEHDPDDDPVQPGPSPADLGFAPAPPE